MFSFSHKVFVVWSFDILLFPLKPFGKSLTGVASFVFMLSASIGTSATYTPIGGAGASAVSTDDYNGYNSGGVRVPEHHVSIDSFHGVAEHSEEEVSLSRFFCICFHK